MNEVLHHYKEIMTDPAHLMAEVSLMLLVDVFFLGLIWPLAIWLFRRTVRREHLAIDAEHGVTHGAPKERMMMDDNPTEAPPQMIAAPIDLEERFPVPQVERTEATPYEKFGGIR